MKKELAFFEPSVVEIKSDNIRLFDTFEISKLGFDDYINTSAIYDKENGNGVTYAILDHEEVVVAYYTLAVTTILCTDRYKEEDGTYDEAICGIPSVEIKMFAVNDNYQDCLYKGELISAMILKYIINYIDELSTTTVGIKAVFLHSVADAKEFYIKNGFKEMEFYMSCLHSVDGEHEPLYFPIRKFTIHYDE